MLTVEHQKTPCEYCGRGLMPVKSLEWDTRRYHKNCNKKIIALENAQRLYKIINDEQNKRNKLMERLTPSLIKASNLHKYS